MSIRRTYALRWADVDANGHVRHSVYPELGAEVRLAWLKESGFDWKSFQAAGVGPVLLREEIDYLRELELGAEVTVDLEALALSPEGGRWTLRHTIRRSGGEEAARLVVTGGWLDLARRKLIVPPEELASILRTAPRAPEFVELPPLRR
jgi:acyl-CoA thioester hydrolase